MAGGEVSSAAPARVGIEGGAVRLDAPGTGIAGGELVMGALAAVGIEGAAAGIAGGPLVIGGPAIVGIAGGPLVTGAAAGRSVLLDAVSSSGAVLSATLGV